MAISEVAARTKKDAEYRRPLNNLTYEQVYWASKIENPLVRKANSYSTEAYLYLVKDFVLQLTNTMILNGGIIMGFFTFLSSNPAKNWQTLHLGFYFRYLMRS